MESIGEGMDFSFTVCSTPLHDKTVGVRQLQKLNVDATCSHAKLKTDAIPISIIYSTIFLPIRISYMS
jgi:hypothetical protein